MELSLEKYIEKSNFISWKDFYAKYEPIVWLNLDIYSNEILFRINNYNNAHISFLSELRARNETFLVFIKVCKKAFEDVFNTWKNININLEIQDLMNPLFLSYIESLTNEFNINTSKVNFEILENEEITEDNRSVILWKIRLLSKKWFKITIDDLFSWYSHKQRIDFLLSKWVNLEMVKIDGRFIQDAYLCNKYWYDCKEIKKSISLKDIDDLKNYISELKSKWIKVVAEWIETEDMFIFVKSLWIEYFQWYLFQNFENDKLFKI